MFMDWGSLTIPSTPPYPSRIGDDHSPFEYSVAFAPHGPELRLLFEAQASTPTDLANQRAAVALNRRLAARSGVHMKRFDEISDLFLRDQETSEFSLWHAVCFNRGQPPMFKLYLNPQVRGTTQAWRLLSEAMSRLGLSAETLRYVAEALRRPDLDQLSYFSLDLADHAKARVKVYVAHHAVAPQYVDDIFGICPAHRVGDVVAFCDSMVGNRQSFERKPLMSCLSFTSDSDRPNTMTLHLPIAHYVDSDEVVSTRVGGFLREHGLDHAGYRTALNAIAKRPLSSARGIQSYASYRREAGALRFTAYLSPELFAVADRRKAPPSSPPPRVA
jgi:DMATS type aromatic prenyltransferase